MEHPCPTCLFNFKGEKSLKQHVCLVKICSPDEAPDLVLRSEGEIKRLEKAVGKFKSSNWQLIKFCQQTKTALPGLYPLFFPIQRQNNYPVLGQLGSILDSYSLLKAAAREGPVKLPRTLKMGIEGRILQIDSCLLTPSSKQYLKGFNVVLKQNHMLITKKVSKKPSFH